MGPFLRSKKVSKKINPLSFPRPRTNLSHHPSIFESTDEHRDHLSDLSNRKRQTIDSEPVTEPKKAKIVIPKQEDTILNVFKSDLEKQAYKELLDPRKSKFESNFHATKAIQGGPGSMYAQKPSGPDFQMPG